MADTKKIMITNSDPGERGINTVSGMVMIAPGASQEVEVAAGEADNLPDYFKPGGSKASGEEAEPGPLDQSIADLEKHLEGVDDPAEIDRLIEAERGGKSRSGALAALEARKAALAA